MKLLFCTACHDVVKLDYLTRHCSCGASCGEYQPCGRKATIRGDSARAIGLANPDVAEAVRRPDHATIRCWMMDPDRAPNLTWDPTP